MNNNLKSAALIVMMVAIPLKNSKKIETEEHPVENKFFHDTFLRINLASLASITASAATDSVSIKTLQNFTHKLK